MIYRMLKISKVIGLCAGLGLVSGCFDKEPPMNSVSPQELFINKLEQKYKREAYRNDIDLHFTVAGPKKLKIISTYKQGASVELAYSITNGAAELVRGLKQQDPVMRELELEVEKEVLPRAPDENQGR